MNTLPVPPSMAERVDALDWSRLRSALDVDGFAATGPLLQPSEARALRERYDEDPLYRSTVDMARHGFGRGQYRYYAYPLPAPVQALRAAFYPRLQPVANDWHARMGLAARFPETLEAMLARCHAAGQRRPTPLQLRYGVDDYNCLHQDLYGEHVFPLQVVILLSDPGDEFDGGELVLVEQRPRRQSRAHVVRMGLGEAVIMAVHHRPVTGTRGDYRVVLKHGVSTLRSGHRHTLGLIFHDAA